MYPPGYNCCCDPITWVLRPCQCCDSEVVPPPHFYVRSGQTITQRSYNKALLTTDGTIYTMYWWDPAADSGAGAPVVVTVEVDNPGGAGPDNTVGKVAEKIANAWNAEVGVTISATITATWDNDGHVIWTGQGDAIVFSIGHFAYTAGAWESALNPVTNNSSGDLARYPAAVPGEFAAAALSGNPVMIYFGGPAMNTVPSAPFEPRHLIETDDVAAPVGTCYTVEVYDSDDEEHGLDKLVELDWRLFFISEFWIEDAEDPARYFEANFPIATNGVSSTGVDCGDPPCDDPALSCPTDCGDFCVSGLATITVSGTVALELDDDSTVQYEFSGSVVPEVCTGDTLCFGSVYEGTKPACTCADLVAAPVQKWHSIILQDGACGKDFAVSIQEYETGSCPTITYETLVNLAFTYDSMTDSWGITVSDNTWSLAGSVLVDDATVYNDSVQILINDPMPYTVVGGECVLEVAP